MTPKKKKIGRPKTPRKRTCITCEVDENVKLLLNYLFGTATKGLTFLANIIPSLWMETLTELKGYFTLYELRLLVKSGGGSGIGNWRLAGHNIIKLVELTYPFFKHKWMVDLEGLTKKLQALTFWQRVVVEMWVYCFPIQKKKRLVTGVDMYISPLLQNSEGEKHDKVDQ